MRRGLEFVIEGFIVERGLGGLSGVWNLRESLEGEITYHINMFKCTVCLVRGSFKVN